VASEDTYPGVLPYCGVASCQCECVSVYAVLIQRATWRRLCNTILLGVGLAEESHLVRSLHSSVPEGVGEEAVQGKVGRKGSYDTASLDWPLDKVDSRVRGCRHSWWSPSVS
jgi:hypothetical protein